METRTEAIKTLIECALSWREADGIIEKFAGIIDIKEKIGYIKGMFGVSVIGRDAADTEIDKNDYIAMLSTVVDEKWR